jgi:hypothetical protein
MPTCSTAPLSCSKRSTARPDLTGLAPRDCRARVKVETRDDGTVTVTVQGDIPEELEQRLIAT